MAKKDRKKQRREQKKKQQRLDGSSLAQLHRVASRGKVLMAYITADWRESGMASLTLLRQGPAGRHVMAAFLIDFWCLGLKDTYGYIGISEADLAERRAQMNQEGVPTESITLDEARSLVAGAIRWTREHGFKLPPQTERWLPVLGEGLDIDHADTSGFGGEDGKLVYSGTMPDLARRLRDGDVHKFCAREDVEYTFVLPDPDGPYADGILADEDKDERLDPEEREAVESYRDEIDAVIAEQGPAMMNRVLDWCREQRVTPHPQLGDAVKLVIAASMVGDATGDDTTARELMARWIADDPACGAALEQVRSATRPFDSGEVFAAAIEARESAREAAPHAGR